MRAQTVFSWPAGSKYGTASRAASCSLDVTQHARKILYDDAFSYSRFFRFSNIMESYAPILMKQKALVSA